MNRNHILQMAAAAVVTAMPTAVFAASYASELSLTGTSLSLRLNDSANQIDVIIDGTTTQTFTGPFTAGTQNLTLSSAPASGYQVVVRQTAAAGYNTPADVNVGSAQQVGANIPMNAPRGVAVNTDPASPFFGRFYVANVTANATRGDGIYVFNSDGTETFAQGTVARTGGLTFVDPDPDTNPTAATSNWPAVSASSPWRLEVGPDGNLYIADFADFSASIYRMDANAENGVNMLTGTGLIVGTGTGNIRSVAPGSNHADISSSPIVTGTAAGGDLKIYTLDGSMGVSGDFQRLRRYDLNSTASGYSGTPVDLANPLINTAQSVTADLDIGNDQKFYLSQNRSAGTESGLFVLKTDGTTVLYRSLTDTRQITQDPASVDLLRMTRAISVSPDGTKLAISRDDSNTSVVPLLAGIPDLANLRIVLTGGVILGRDIGWDAAGNFYTANSGSGAIKIYGGGNSTVSITDSAGKFTTESQWTAAAGGTFGDTANWLAAAAPADAASNGYSAASFGQAAAQTVTLGSNTNLTTLRLNSTNSYTIGGASTLNMDGFGPNVIVEKGSHTISAPMNLVSSTGFNVYDAADTLTVSGAVTTGGSTGIVKAGAGTVAFTGGVDTSNVNWVGAYEGTLSLGDDIAGPGGVPQARVTVESGATLNATGVRATLLRVNGTANVATNGTPTGMVVVTHNMATAGAFLSGITVGAAGKLNMNDNDMIVDYTLNPSDPLNTTPEFTLRDRVLQFRNGDGSVGIGFTETVAEDTILAFGLSSELAITSFQGVAVDDTTVVGKYTYYGDGNLDGQVTTDDYVAVDLGLGTGDSWVQGDFDLNGSVTTDDYVVVDLNLGKGTTNPLAFADEQARMIALHTEMFGQSYLDKLAYASEFGWVAASVPEPGALSLVGLGATALLGRRRRRLA